MNSQCLQSTSPEVLSEVLSRSPVQLHSQSVQLTITPEVLSEMLSRSPVWGVNSFTALVNLHHRESTGNGNICQIGIGIGLIQPG